MLVNGMRCQQELVPQLDHKDYKPFKHYY